MGEILYLSPRVLDRVLDTDSGYFGQILYRFFFLNADLGPMCLSKLAQAQLLRDLEIVLKVKLSVRRAWNLSGRIRGLNFHSRGSDPDPVNLNPDPKL